MDALTKEYADDLREFAKQAPWFTRDYEETLLPIKDVRAVCKAVQALLGDEGLDLRYNVRAARKPGTVYIYFSMNGRKEIAAKVDGPRDLSVPPNP